MSLPEETSPIELRLRAKREAAPEPTTAPEIHPDLGYMPILKNRAAAGTDTCGFHTDDDVEITCGSTATCTNSGGYRDCCVKSRCTASSFRTTCYDSTASQCSGTAPVGAHCCTYSYAPFCVTYLWSTSATPNSAYTLIACESESKSGFNLLAAEQSTTSDTSRSTRSSTRTTSSASSSSSTSSSASPSGSLAGSSSDSSSGNNASSAPVGAIVGGVIGGLALIALTALALFFILRKRKPRAPAPATFGSPPTAMSQHPSPYHNTHSMYGAPPSQGSSPPQEYGQQYAYAPAPSPGAQSWGSPNSQSGLYAQQHPASHPSSPQPHKDYYANNAGHTPPIQHLHPHMQPQIAEMGGNSVAPHRAELG